MKRHYRSGLLLSFLSTGLLLSCLPVFAYTHYVSPSGSHAPPFTNWPSAATNIQAAVDAAGAGGVVLVTNGVYDTGGTVIGSLTNRVVATNGVTVQSCQGPLFTSILGSGPLGPTAVRPVYLGPNANLRGFTIRNGHTATAGDYLVDRSGGGMLCEPGALVEHCIIVSNVCDYGGGGVRGGTLRSCLLAHNETVGGDGGGAFFPSGALNCTIVSNAAYHHGGGVFGGTYVNCIVRGNTNTGAGGVDNWFSGAAGQSIRYSNTVPGWDGTCITSDPQFVGAFHLGPYSPCIDAASNEVWMAEAVDLDGLPRVFGTRADMGAYEWPHIVITGIAPPAPSGGPVIRWLSFGNERYTVYGSTNLVHGYDVPLWRGNATPPENAFTDTVSGVEMRGYTVSYRQ